MKAKIFSETDQTLLEEQMNTYFREHPGVIVEKMSATESNIDGVAWTTVILLVTENKFLAE